MKRQANGQHAAQTFEARHTQRNILKHQQTESVHYGDGIVMPIGDEDAIGGRRDAVGAGAAQALSPKLNARLDELQHLGTGRVFNVQHTQGIGFGRAGAAQARGFIGAAFGLARRKAEGGPFEARLARLLAIRARDGLVFKHAQVGDVGPAAIGRQGDRKRQTAHAHALHQTALPGIEDHHAEVGLVHDVEQVAASIKHQVAGIAIGEATLVQFEFRDQLTVRRINEPHRAGVALRRIKLFVRVEGQPHKDAAPIVTVLLFLGVVNALRLQRPHLPTALIGTIKKRE